MHIDLGQSIAMNLLLSKRDGRKIWIVVPKDWMIIIEALMGECVIIK